MYFGAVEHAVHLPAQPIPAHRTFEHLFAHHSRTVECRMFVEYELKILALEALTRRKKKIEILATQSFFLG